jgi:hypothetical protein
MFVYRDKELNHQLFTNDLGLIFRLALRNRYFYVSGMFPSSQEGEFKGGTGYEFLFKKVFLSAPSFHPKNGFIHKKFLLKVFVNLHNFLSNCPKRS